MSKMKYLILAKNGARPTQKIFKNKGAEKEGKRDKERRKKKMKRKRCYNKPFSNLCTRYIADSRYQSYCNSKGGTVSKVEARDKLIAVSSCGGKEAR